MHAPSTWLATCHVGLIDLTTAERAPRNAAATWRSFALALGDTVKMTFFFFVLGGMLYGATFMRIGWTYYPVVYGARTP